ncbi:MAG: sigma-70 family RNA polymerase sigma factor [Verrucomicrobiota bacterium]
MSAKSENHPHPADAELVRAAQRGEKRAFVEIVARHQVMVCGVTLGVLGDFTAGEDAAQEAFVTAWRKIQDLREPEKLRAWLARIARNAALGHLRRTRGVQFVEMDERWADEDQLPPDELAVSGEESALVRDALGRLPENYRLPLVLFYRQDQSVREVAETLGLGEDAVKQRLARGREMLRERMTGLIETALRHTQPGAIFTIAIAAAIGALAAPAVMAGGAFAAAAALGSASAATTASTAASVSTTPAAITTAMTTSKASLVTAALVAFACLPVGYAVHQGTHPPPPPPEKVAVKPLPGASEAAAKPDFGDSELFAEWVRLHEEHGQDARAMPALFKAISEIKDTFRRRAFRAALTAEWAQVDPAGGLDFFISRNGDRAQCRQLFLQWLSQDPQAAMTRLTSLGKAGDDLAGESAVLLDIARRAPEFVAAIASRLPENRDHWSHPVADAFAVLAGSDLESARSAAETLTGSRRGEALAGVAKAWAQKDFAAMAAWTRNLPADIDREDVLRSGLMGLAATDPKAALENASMVPPGGRSGYFADSTAARLLKEAGAKDFEGTTAWLRDHPGKISGEDVQGLAGIVTERLNADPVKFLAGELKKGTLEVLDAALGSALLNDSKPQLAKVWEWLKGAPDSAAVRRLRDTVINSATYQNPALALAIAKELPSTPEGEKDLNRIAQSLLNAGSRMNRLESLLSDAPPALRSRLLTNAFSFLNPDNFVSASLWLPRLEELPAGARGDANRQVAQAWAAKNPEDAAAWALRLPAENRSGVIGNVAGGWLKNDSLAASEWISQLPAGPDRDAGAHALVREVAADSPDEAWQWAVSIGDGAMRMQAAGTALGSLAQRNPQEALHWIDSAAALTEAEKQQLRQSVGAGAAGKTTSPANQ